MPTPSQPSSPWHVGEQQLQAREGVSERMEELGARVVRDHLTEQHQRFYQQLTFVLLGSVDKLGQPWASIVEGPEGFAHSPHPQRLQLNAALAEDDPACLALHEGAPVGLLGIELHTRRRNRMNGRIAERHEQGLSITVEQAFGNCPRYIQPRQRLIGNQLPRTPGHSEHLNHLDQQAQRLISDSDTFFVASYVLRDQNTAEVDVSHRGGPKGFVHVHGNRLTIPDFSGNRFFNTLGNLLINPQAGLLFVDFASGELLQLSGRTSLTLDDAAIAFYPEAERLWHVDVKQVIRRYGALTQRWRLKTPNHI